MFAQGIGIGEEINVKKRVLCVLLISVMAVLIGCHTSRAVREETLLPMAQSYRGVLPCADCAGIDTSLFLQGDGSFILQQNYQTDRPGNTLFATYGQWARTADKLVLTNTGGEKLYFRPLDKGLEMLDANGTPVVSSHSYRLSVIEAPLPTTPMAMRGMYRYFADAAVFTDCVTGITSPVVNNIALEKQFLKVQQSPGQAVLLALNAYFAIAPSMEEGQTVKSVVPSDSYFEMNANQRCED